MTYQEVLSQARTCLGKYCKGCEICNGRVCRNQIPGPGAKGVGDTAIRNYDKWKEMERQGMKSVKIEDLENFEDLLET